MYLYEMHQHTNGCSLCGKVSPQEMVQSVKECGFSGVVLTNHFYHGNTAIDRRLPWQDFCKAYEDEYLLAKAAGEKIGIDVIYGLEEGVGDGKEVLIYGIEPGYISNFPELSEVNLQRLSEVVRGGGGVLIQAHPYRDRSYISNVDSELPYEFIDGYEVFNKYNAKEENEKAVAFARPFKKIVTSGSDSHTYLDDGRFGIACEHRITNEKELVNVLKNRDYKLFYCDYEE